MAELKGANLRPQILLDLPLAFHFLSEQEILQTEVQNELAKIPLPSNLQKAVSQRRQEFLGGRYCAQRAMGQKEWNLAFHLGINADRSPQWPEEWIGSITHTQGLAGAVATKNPALRGLGLDLERRDHAPRVLKVKRMVLVEEEEKLLLEKTSAPHSLDFSVLLLFSAKEALYKCLYPLVLTYFGFHQAKLRDLRWTTQDQGELTLTLEKDLGTEFPQGKELTGRFEIMEDYLLTFFSYPYP